MTFILAFICKSVNDLRTTFFISILKNDYNKTVLEHGKGNIYKHYTVIRQKLLKVSFNNYFIWNTVVFNVTNIHKLNVKILADMIEWQIEGHK